MEVTQSRLAFRKYVLFTIVQNGLWGEKRQEDQRTLLSKVLGLVHARPPCFLTPLSDILLSIHCGPDFI